MTETSVFTTTSGNYLSTLVGLWLPRHGWKIAVPLVAVAAAGIAIPDERLILVALMLLFIVVPMGMSFLYTYYMLTPEARRAVLPKQVVIDPGRSLTLRYVKEVVEKDADGDEEAREEMPVPDDEVIEWSEIRRVKFASTVCIYILSTDRLQFIMVPYEAVPKGAVLA